MFTKLLVPLDGSAIAEDALGRAVALAQRCNAGIDVLIVREPPLIPVEAMRASADGHLDASYIERIARDLSAETSLAVTCGVMDGTPAEAIRERAKHVNADLIVMTTHGRTGLSRAWLGSVADAVMRNSSIPVLMLRPKEAERNGVAAPDPFEHVLVPLDGSAVAADILSVATDLAAVDGARVTLLRVVPPVPLTMAIDSAMPLVAAPTIPDEEATAHLAAEISTQVGELARQIHDRTKLSVDAEVSISERTAEAINSFAVAHGNDVIAMSTQGRGVSRLLIGSVADKVLRSTALPVLLRRSTRSGTTDDALTEQDIVEQLPALAPS